MMNYDIKNYYEWPILPKIIMTGLICLIVFLFGYYWDFASLNTRNRVLIQQEGELKQQLEMIFKQQAVLKLDLSKQAELNHILTASQEKLVKGRDLPSALNEILKIGSANGIQFQSFNPNKEESENIYTKVPIKVVAQGSYDQMANFIDQVAHMVPLISVDNFIFKRSEVEGAQQNVGGPLTAEIILNAYYLSETNHAKK